MAKLSFTPNLYCCFKTCHTKHCYKVYLNLFWLAVSPIIEWQQPSFKFSFSTIRLPPYFSIYNIKYKVQEKKLWQRFKLKISSWNFLRPYSWDIDHILRCCGLQDKIIRNHGLENSKLSLNFPKARQARYVTLHLCYHHYRKSLFMSYLKIFCMDLYWKQSAKHYKDPQKLFSNFFRKNTLHSANISRLKLNKNMGVAMWNMAESLKKIS